MSRDWWIVAFVALAILAGIAINLPDAMEATANYLRFA